MKYGILKILASVAKTLKIIFSSGQCRMELHVSKVYIVHWSQEIEREGNEHLLQENYEMQWAVLWMVICGNHSVKYDVKKQNHVPIERISNYITLISCWKFNQLKVILFQCWLLLWNVSIGIFYHCGRLWQERWWEESLRICLQFLRCRHCSFDLCVGYTDSRCMIAIKNKMMSGFKMSAISTQFTAINKSGDGSNIWKERFYQTLHQLDIEQC